MHLLALAGVASRKTRGLDAMTLTMRAVAVVLALAAAGVNPVAAQVPDTDIWLSDVIVRGHTLELGTPVNVTHRPGYDNQPAFLYRGPLTDGSDTPDRSLLFTAGDSLGSTEIYRWDPVTRQSTRVTLTPESEYSPTPIQGAWGPIGFYTVRVEADSTQRLWKFDLDGSNPRLVMSDVDSVGYFAWIDDTHVAMFVLGNEKKKEPHTLRVVDIKTQSETIVARDIGRSIQLIPGTGDVSFTVEEADDTFRFMRLGHGRAAGEPLIRATGTGQDAAWLGDGTMLMSAGTTIYAARPIRMGSSTSVDAVWRAVRDFAGLGITSITRIAVAPDQSQIAFVAVKAAP
jgi:hypothetical protein